MLDLSKHRFLKYLLFGNLYFANGIQGTIGIVILITYFTEKDISIAIATLVAGGVSMVFAFKFLLGPLTDYFIKYGRKPFVIIGILMAAIPLFPLAFIDPSVALIPLTFLLFINVFGIVLMDVAADAWAIQTTEIHEHGKINAAMFGSLFGGMAIANVFLAYIAKHFSYSMTFIVAGFIITLTIILPLIVKEKKIVKKRPKIAKLVVHEFKKKNTLLVAFFGLISAMNFGMILFVIPEYMMNALNLDIAQIGLITALFPIGTVMGAITGGMVSDKWGRKRPLYFFLFGAIIFSSLLIFANSWQILAIIYPIIGFLQGGATFSAIMALFMDITNPKIGATQYSILTSLSNFGDYSIAMLSGTLVVILGYSRFFLYSAWIVGPALVLLYFIKETRQ